MAITVEDGSVVANADSYVSVAFADAYFTIDVNYDTTWAALTTADKEQRLKMATRILDQKVKWNGVKVDDTSALRWPRSGVYDRDDILIADDEMPTQLLQLTCEVAKFLETVDPTTSQGADYLKSVKVDVVEIVYQDGSGQPVTPPIFNQLLRGLGYYPTAMGSSFAKIVKV